MKKNLSQTALAKKMRKMRKNETAKEKRKRLDHRNALLNIYKLKQKSMKY